MNQLKILGMMKALLAVIVLGTLTACETTGQSFAVNVGNVSGGYVGGGGNYGWGGGQAYYRQNSYVIPYGIPQPVGYYVNPTTGWNTPIRPVYNNCQPRVYVQNPW